MTLILKAMRGAVGVVIITLNGIGFLPREAAIRLVPLQKLLTKQIEIRRWQE